jgi:ribosome-binding protein aMBF1 (putative translation factor)
MGKCHYCDLCGKITWVLYDIVLKDGTIISVCRECFYSTPIDKVELGN